MAKYSDTDWEELRATFASSPMTNIKLSALAENMGSSWPISGSDETPAKYLDLNFKELQFANGLAGKPDRIDLLIDILRETLAFDNPFGDMVGTQVESGGEGEQFTNALEKLGIPEEFPIGLTNLSGETKEFCTRESLDTVGSFVNFCQNMAKSIVIGGDYRSFLNALAHVDEEQIGNFLPYRKGAKGLHLPETIKLAVRLLPEAEQAAVCKSHGAQLTSEQEAKARGVSAAQIAEAEKKVFARVEQYLPWLGQEPAELTRLINSGSNLDRYLVVLNDPRLEPAIGKMLRKVLFPKQREEGGFFKSLGRLFGK